MEYPIRPITPDEYRPFMRAIEAAYGGQPSDEEVDIWRPVFEFDRSLAAFDGERIVASAGALSFELTLPGLTMLPAAGVSWVSVFPTYRRRGLLRALMRRQLDDVRERGEPLAILSASESSIYGRFGYGMATQTLRLEIESSHGTFAQPFEEAGVITLIDRDTAARVLPQVYDRARRDQPGGLTRSSGMWCRTALRSGELAGRGQRPLLRHV